MKFRARKSLKIGTRNVHWKANFTATSGYTGWGVKVGPWSYTSRTGKQRLNTPGLGYIEWGGKKKPRSGRQHPGDGGVQ